MTLALSVELIAEKILWLKKIYFSVTIFMFSTKEKNIIFNKQRIKGNSRNTELPFLS